MWLSAIRPAAAVTPVRPLDLRDVGAPTFTRFGSYNGLPDTIIVAVRTDRDGFTWAATNTGLSRYDGQRWSSPDDPALAHPVNSLLLDHQGTLWAPLRNYGLARYDGVHWQVSTPADGLPSARIVRLAETRDGQGRWQLWALTQDRGLLRYQQGRWVADPDNAGLPHEGVLSLAHTASLGGHPRLWVGTESQGLWYRDEGTRGWRRWRAPGLEPNQVQFLLATDGPDGEELWIAMYGDGLARLRRDGLRYWTPATGLANSEIYDLASSRLEDGSLAVWVASRTGLIRIHHEHMQVFDSDHGLPSSSIRGLNVWTTPDRRQVLWVATESGVARTMLDATPWTTATLMGAQSTGVFAELVEPDGHGGERLWVGSSNNGLGLYQDGRWRHFTTANSALPSNNVRMLRASGIGTPQAQYWLGMWAGQLVRMRPTASGVATFEQVPTPWRKFGGNSVMDILEDAGRDGPETWIALRQGGIWRRHRGRWSEQHATGVSGTWRVGRLLLQRRDGRTWLWAATNQGLARFDGRRWTIFGRGIGLASSYLLDASLASGRDGRPVLWLASADAGVERVDVSDPAHPRVLDAAPLPPPPDLYTYSALFDSRGRVYVCTNAGIQLLQPRADGGYDSNVFTRKDGLVHDECNANGQLVDRHDRYWAGTMGGLSVYDPQAIRADTQPKPLRLLAVRADGASLPPGPVRLAAGARDLEVEFALLAWRGEDDSRFRTQLIGYEDTPGAWSGQRLRSFNALPPGDYRLHVEARDYAGNASTPLDIPIHVAGHWWQSGWARAALVTALLLLGYGVALLRTRALRHSQRLLERRVAERTAELHQANARLVELSYRDALTGLANRRGLLEMLERQPAGSTMALLFVDVDDFKAYNDRLGHPAGDEALSTVAQSISACVPGHALVARYGGEEFAVLLPDTGLEAAVDVAECCRATVAGRSVAVPGTDRHERVTISVGVALVRPGPDDSIQDLLREADMALYQAKRTGKNRVCVHGAGAERME
ncbi:MAG: diguanylate cyclase [Pseudoxanthomonas sp.]